jgi:hypothetical protein
MHLAKGETGKHYLWNFWLEITVIVFGPKKFGDEEGGRHECWIMTPFHFHWCPFAKEYALLLTNCTPCHQQLPTSLIEAKSWGCSFTFGENISAAN